MATASDISVGLAHELVITGCKAGLEPADFAALAKSEEKMKQVLAFVRGLAEIIQVEYIIDCDAAPFVPDGWSVEEHRRGGQMAWDSAKVGLYLSNRQKGGKVVKGHDLREDLRDKPVLNANALDYLLAHPHLIPEDWKGKAAFFWGTIYRNRDGDLCVRCLYWSGGRWYWNYFWLDSDWISGNPAAVPAS
jgi:hypothetical protein